MVKRKTLVNLLLGATLLAALFVCGVDLDNALDETFQTTNTPIVPKAIDPRL